MSTVTITADVYSTRSEGAPVYRVYVDGDLLTERTWVWPAYETYICEHIEVDVDPGQHRLELVDCSRNGVFYLKNITVNGVAHDGTVFTVNGAPNNGTVFTV
jgi:hypothetical protein